MTTTDPRYAVIAAWEVAKKKLDEAKAAESQARIRLIAECYPQQAKTTLEGTHNIPLENGFKLKGVFGLNYTVDKDRLPALLTDMASGSEAAQFAADKLFRYKPELNVTVYKNLMPSVKAMVDAVVTTKPALPTFEIVESKRP